MNELIPSQWHPIFYWRQGADREGGSMSSIVQGSVGLTESPRPTELQLTAQWGIHATRQISHSVETWMRGGNGRAEFDLYEKSNLESFEGYDIQGQLTLNGNSSPALPGAQALTGPQTGLRPRSRPSLRLEDPARRIGPRAHDRLEKKGCEEGACSEDQLKLKILERLLGLKPSKRLDPEAFQRQLAEAQASAQAATEAVTSAGAQAQGEVWLDAGHRETTHIRESVEFEARLMARVDNGDGSVVEQSVDVKLKVSREFYELTESRVQFGQKKDPLVLDLTGEGIDLTGIENGTVFDLDGDGDAERGATVQNGTALLWMDRNENGILDDGSELFGDFRGAQDGFEDLARLDENGDGRVNAQDAQFGYLQLRLNPAHQPRDLTLAQAGIVSLELSKLTLPADMGAAASLDAVGVFLRDDGRLGTMADVRLGMES